MAARNPCIRGMRAYTCPGHHTISAAHWSQDIAHQLSEMSEKQLSHVAPMLDEYILAEVRISAKIHGRNQGRRRQEGLIAKMLRNLPGLDLDNLQASNLRLLLIPI